MRIQVQALILAVLILVSVAVTGIGSSEPRASASPADYKDSEKTAESPGFSYERASLLGTEISAGKYKVREAPKRNWDVLDPQVSAEAVLIQSLDESFPFFNYNTYKVWPMASLTKLIASLVVLEDIGENKKMVIDEKIIETEGEAGGLRSGEVFSARDLLKVMLLTSSNDAAAAFESYVGEEEFMRLMNQKIKDVGIVQTEVFDGSGLNDGNVTSASDMLRLGKYILEKKPEIFNWTRLRNQVIQPLNDTTSRTVYNINNLVDQPYFLGGKTGTSEKARENLLAVVSFKNTRLIAIILGSYDRYGELESLLDWVGKAYDF